MEMTFKLDGRTIDLPATPYPKEATREVSAWKNGNWLTVRLLEDLYALRVHTDGKRVDLRDVDPTKAWGNWILIDDVIYTSSQIVQNRSLPGVFTRTSRLKVFTGTVLNIGICGPLFNFQGGGWQAEYRGGRQMELDHLTNIWMNRSGLA